MGPDERHKPSVKGMILLFLQRFGEVMGDFVLGALYFLLIGPVAIVSRLLDDPLRRRRPRDGAFVPSAGSGDTLRAARRQG